MTVRAILTPFDRREVVTVRQASAIAGRSETTLRGWCELYGIGRRVVGGPWQVSRVALAMLLDGDEAALRAYHAGERTGPLVGRYFKAIGMVPVLEAT